jgi:hypothetical protein
MAPTTYAQNLEELETKVTKMSKEKNRWKYLLRFDMPKEEGKTLDANHI